MLESTTMPCSFCHGTGVTRSDESLALQILRDLDKEGSAAKIKDTLSIKAPVQTTNYLINSKRDHMLIIEDRYQINIELHADASLISPHYLIENTFDDKRVKKNTDRNKPRAKKKDKENPELANEQKVSANAIINEGQTEASEEQKKRKRKRKKKHQKDAGISPQTESKTKYQQGQTPSIEGENLTNKTGNSKITQGEIASNAQNLKKEKPAKPRTRVSAKKTIERLNTDDGKSIENDGNIRDSKMGKKGWWDR